MGARTAHVHEQEDVNSSYLIYKLWASALILPRRDLSSLLCKFLAVLARGAEGGM